MVKASGDAAPLIIQAIQFVDTYTRIGQSTRNPFGTHVTCFTSTKIQLLTPLLFFCCAALNTITLTLNTNFLLQKGSRIRIPFCPSRVAPSSHPQDRFYIALLCFTLLYSALHLQVRESGFCPLRVARWKGLTNLLHPRLYPLTEGCGRAVRMPWYSQRLIPAQVGVTALSDIRKGVCCFTAALLVQKYTFECRLVRRFC